ncbi:MAG: type III pantothenate kinase [Bacteroidales bacterium]|jgi:type III pantothenate kinase|nr:type III pantothenate kinase [Bacteroidales bacterium]OQA92736.1 MAG: Type III pantothenate kinase [Bacteroidetes bacterium ADurb.Bin234]
MLNKLILDFGNSLHKAAVVDNGNMVFFSNYPSFNLNALKQLEKEFQFKNVLLSSVIQADNILEEYLHKHYSFLKLSEKTPLPIINQYQSPETLGYDRIACAVAANHLFPQHSVLTVQFGSCITFDLVNAQKAYKGGSIAPGLKMRFNALHQFTQKLPLLDYKPIDFLVGTNTEESILSGVINGIVNECNGIINAYHERYPNLKVIVSGGDSSYFDKLLNDEIITYPNLVMLGLSLILNHNVEKQN